MANFFSNLIEKTQTKVGQKLTGIQPENLLTPETQNRAKANGLPVIEAQPPKTNFFSDIAKSEPVKATKNFFTGLAKGIGELAVSPGYLADLATKDTKFESPLTPEQIEAEKKQLAPEGKTQEIAHAIGSLSPGGELVKPALEKSGVPSKVALGIGLGIDVLTPGPGELKTGKALKEAKVIKEAESVVHNISGEEFKIVDKGATHSMVRSQKTNELLTVPNEALESKFSIKKSVAPQVPDPLAQEARNKFGVRYGEEIKDKAIQLYREGKSSTQISKELGVSGDSVLTWTEKAGIKRTISQSTLLYEKDIPKVIELYKQGKNTTEISKELNLAPSSVARWVKEAGITRSNSEVQSILAELGKTNVLGVRSKVSTKFGTLNADSTYEAIRIKQLEADPNVVGIKRATRIPLGDGRHYIPDIEIKYKDGSTVIEEIKPVYKLGDEKIIAKEKAAREFLKDKNIEYRIVSENDIGIDAFKNANIDDFTFGSEEIKSRFANAIKKAQVKTKSQLADLYNNATKGIEEVSADIRPLPSKVAVPDEVSVRPDQTIPPTKIQPIEQPSTKMISGSDSLDTAYQKIDPTGTVKKVDSQLSPSDLNPKNSGAYKDFKNKVSDWWLNTREYVEDDWVRFKKLLKDPNVKVEDASNPYQKETLFHGKVSGRLDEGKEIVRKIDQDILETSKKLNVPDKQISDDVNRYLVARHAPERNASLGPRAAGMSDDEAKAIIKEIESSPAGAEVKRIADTVQDYNYKTLEILKEGGVIDDVLYNTLRKKYKNHVPLQRIFDDSESVDQFLTGRGFDVKGTGLKRAKGSEREVADILENVTANYEQAVIRAEKNVVDNATLKFARENKHLGIFEEIKPKAIGRSFKGDILMENIKDPSVLALRENGKPVYLKIKDPHMAAVLKGVNRQKVDGLLKFVASFTRFYSGLMTRFNPEFAFPNKIRDLQETMVYLASKNEIGFKGAAKAVTKDASSVKDVYDFIRGTDSAGAKIYKQMIADGGTTGGLGLSTRKQVELDLAQIRKLNRSTPRMAAKKVVDMVDNWNKLFEDSTRLSVYKQALESGLSRDRAAAMAKEASINFNKMGKGGPLINSLWMFSNASIQGSAKLLRSMKNPKVAGTVIAGVSGAVLATSEWNDRVDPDWRDKVSKWDRLNGLTVVLPGGSGDNFNYVTVPVSWGLKPIKVSAEYAMDTMNGKGEGFGGSMSAIVSSVLESYNPIGGTDLVSAGVPTLLDLPVDLARNKAWSGSKIRPDFDSSAPASTLYFRSLRESPLGRGFISATRGISEKTGGRIEISPADVNYAYQQLVGGTGRFLSKSVTSGTDLAKGELPPVREIPFASRFLRSVPNEETGKASGEANSIKRILSEQSRDRFYLKQDAEVMFEEMKKMPKEERAATWAKLAKEQPDIATKLSEIAKDQALGLNYTDRLVKQLGVENGERAKYLVAKFKEAKKEDRAEMWKDMVNKKLLTKDVIKQINYLLAKPK